MAVLLGLWDVCCMRCVPESGCLKQRHQKIVMKKSFKANYLAGQKAARSISRPYGKGNDRGISPCKSIEWDLRFVLNFCRYIHVMCVMLLQHDADGRGKPAQRARASPTSGATRTLARHESQCCDAVP